MNRAIRLLRSLSVSRRLALVFSVSIVILVGLGIWTYLSLSEVLIHGPVYQRLMSSQEIKSTVMPLDSLVVEAHVTGLSLARSKDGADQQTYIQRMEDLRAQFERSYAYWRAAPLPSKTENDLMMQAHEPAVDLFAIAQKELIPAVASGQADEVDSALEQFTGAYQYQRQVMAEVFRVADQVKREQADLASRRLTSIWQTLITCICITVFVLWAMWWLLSRSIRKPLDQALEIARQIAAGNLDVQQATPFHDEPGQLIAGMVDMGQALRDSVDRLQHANFVNEQALAIARGGTWRIDVVNRPDTTWLSPEAQRIMDVSNPDGAMHESAWFSGLRSADRLSGLAPQQVFLQAAQGQSGSYEAIYRYQRPNDGVEVWLHDRGLFMRDDAGRVNSVIGVSFDVSDVYRAQEQMEYSNQTLERALDIAKAATWTQDFSDGLRWVDFSPRAMALLGFREREGNRVRVDELCQRMVSSIGAESAAAIIQSIRSAQEGPGLQYEVKYPLRREADDQVMWLHDIAVLKRDAHGRLISAHGVLRDITTERQAEEAILAAMQEAEAASKAKGEFLANMSHEIRTPMNAIIGLSGLALKNDMPTRIRDYLEKIKLSGEHLLGIINDILDFSKIESGKMEIERIPFELNAVIENVVTLIGDKVDHKGLELLCQVDPNMPRTLLGDPLRIGQILINLANNAVKFTERGQIGIRMQIDERSAQEIFIRFSVEDTGIGLTPEQMGKLFKSFEQADASITRKYGGTGLGLAICKSLAQAMGGDIGVESVYAQGSTFWFTASLGIASQEPVLIRPSVDLRGAHVLVVDDNDAAATILTDMLQSLGFIAQKALSGQQALALVTQATEQGPPFEVIVLDWLMPDMNGLEVASAVQSLALAPAPKLLMLSAHRREELVSGAERLGITHVLSKPVSPSMLVNTMMQLLAGADAPLEQVRPRPRTGTMESKLQHLAGARILLVEDNEINQQVGTELLQSVGMHVDVAPDGQVAVHQVHARRAQGEPYDLVLMDMQMPVMDGVTASRLIRENSDNQALPIVAMTANAMRADRERCLAAGMNGFVAKPIDPDELWRALLEWIRPRQGLGTRALTTASMEPASQADGTFIEALRSLPLMDVTQGMARTGANTAFYASLLRKFVKSQHDSTARIAQSLVERDTGQAQLLAHTLRGVAGNLGISALQTAAAHLEKVLHQQAPVAALQRAMERTSHILEATVEALRAAPGFALHNDADDPDTAEPQQLHALIAQLQQLLDQDDPSAQTLWDTRGRELASVCAHADQIDSAIASYEFENASQLLQADAAHWAALTPASPASP